MAAAGEVIIGKALTGIEYRSVAQGIQPAGGAGEIKFAERAARIAQLDVVPIEAAPEAGEIAARAEPGVNAGEDLLVRIAELIPLLARLIVLAERAGAAHEMRAVVHLGHIEALLQRALIGACPAGEGFVRLVKRRRHILIEDNLCDDVGQRLVGENLIGDGAVDAEVENAQVNVDLGSFPGLLAFFTSFRREVQAFFAVIALLILRVDAELIVEGVALGVLRENRREREMLRIAGFSGPVGRPAGAAAAALRAVQQVERNGHLCVRTGGADNADDLSLRVARDGVDRKIGNGGLIARPGGDGVDGVVARGDLDGLFTAVLIRQVERKGAAFAG